MAGAGADTLGATGGGDETTGGGGGGVPTGAPGVGPTTESSLKSMSPDPSETVRSSSSSSSSSSSTGDGGAALLGLGIGWLAGGAGILPVETGGGADIRTGGGAETLRGGVETRGGGGGADIILPGGGVILREGSVELGAAWGVSRIPQYRHRTANTGTAWLQAGHVFVSLMTIFPLLHQDYSVFWTVFSSFHRRPSHFASAVSSAASSNRYR